MKIAWIQLGGAASAAALMLLMSGPAIAAEAATGITAVAAEELDKRSKQAQESQGESKGMSDSSVRVFVTYAYSIIPDQVPGPDGTPVKVDKSDPNKFVIPNDDARRVIRVATRSAYADVCGLPELAAANYETMVKGEKEKKSWSPEQIMMIDALHLFAVSYFTGNATITDEEGAEEGAAQGEGATTVSKSDGPVEPADPAGQAPREVTAPAPPKCPPEQKERVTNAINAYVRAAQSASAGQ
jgi:hypothetical protein